MGLLHAFFSVSLRADQIVGGTAINFIALGLTGYLFVKLYGSQGTPSDVSTIPGVHLGFLGHGFLGDVFGNLNLLVWVAIALVLVVWVVVFKTPVGLRIRACGEHPRAADTEPLCYRACWPPRGARSSRSASTARSRRT
jgi:simple sugar transport system permease protein